jgi:hypothetical protein
MNGPAQADASATEPHMLAAPSVINVIRGSEIAGKGDQSARWEYTVPGHPVSGLSRQPLSDACRQLIALGVEPQRPVARFREGRATPDLTSTVGVAAGLTVAEPDRGVIHFARYRRSPFQAPLPEPPAPQPPAGGFEA